MADRIVELRILPPFAIGRLGSSPNPMDNYDLVLRDPIAVRRIVPADTIVVDPATGAATLRRPPFEVRFRDAEYRIRPIAPFLEVWARRAESEELVPLTGPMLEELGLGPQDVEWRVHVGNVKAFRRTDDPNDRVEAVAGPFRDHEAHPLLGECANFLEGKVLPLGTVQYVRPSPELPGIRLRFTPAAGLVYGPPPEEGTTDPNIADAVYDPAKGRWKGYVDPVDPTTDPVGVRRATNPSNVYAGQSEANGSQISYGYLDDECDGFVEVTLHTADGPLTAFGRVAAGPPTFAPDSAPVRTVGDDLEQAMFGPDVDAPADPREVEEVMLIVRRALETVRLMNTAQMNGASSQRGVGMARMDYLDVNRALEPIVEPSVADSLAIRARHERVLLSQASGSLAWFARVLRSYDEVGTLTDEVRRKMPALMRGADGRHLALTRRQVNKVRAAAELITRAAAEDAR